MSLHVEVPTFSYSRWATSNSQWRLEGCEFSLPRGNHAVVGVNGSGKSTLLALMAGVLRDGSTAIAIDGAAVGAGNQRERQRHIGYLPQKDGLPGRMTVQDAVSYAAWLKGLSGASGVGAVQEALAATDLAQWKNERCARLSGGTARRAGLACAIVHKPQLLLLDEPTAGLDPLQRDAFNGLLAQSGFAPYVLLATHLTEDVTTVADEVLVLAHGSLRTQTTVTNAAGEERSSSALADFLRRELAT